MRLIATRFVYSAPEDQDKMIPHSLFTCCDITRNRILVILESLLCSFFKQQLFSPKCCGCPSLGLWGVYYLPWLNGRLQHKNHWQLFNEASASSCRPQAEIWSKRNCTNCISVHLIVRRWYLHSHSGQSSLKKELKIYLNSFNPSKWQFKMAKFFVATFWLAYFAIGKENASTR